jgi:1-acyl-sn-glycerol-3-phosphate acyltransferase
MKRIPLADQLPYRFYPPRLQKWLLGPGRLYLSHMLRRCYRVEDIDVGGLETVAALLDRGDGVLLAPNHPDHADCFVMFELSRRLTPFYYMAAYQIFVGKGRFVLPRIGVFPVDREGTDITAFKTGVGILADKPNPLVIFPEGEIYHLADRLTPLREGAAAVATSAARRRADRGKTVWIVPVALKYRFLDYADPLPSLHDAMDRLESRFTWAPQTHRTLVDRIYHYAEGVLGLKEFEYLGQVHSGSLKERVGRLIAAILERIEDRRLGKRHTGPVPVRVKELRRACLDVLADEKTPPAEADALRRDLHDLFVAVQLFSYPGDYVRQCPSLERVAETMMKFEEDLLGVDESLPRGARRAVVRFGAPIDVSDRLAAAGKPRHAVAALTTELEARMQSLLDTIPAGRLLAPTSPPAERKAEAASIA